MNLLLSIGTVIAGGIWSVLSAIDGFEKTGKNDKGEPDSKKAKLSYIKIGRLIAGLILMGFGIVSALGNQEKSILPPQIVRVPNEDDRRKADSLQHIIDSIAHLSKPKPAIVNPDLGFYTSKFGDAMTVLRKPGADSIKFFGLITNKTEAPGIEFARSCAVLMLRPHHYKVTFDERPIILNSFEKITNTEGKRFDVAFDLPGLSLNDTVFLCVKYAYKDSSGQFYGPFIKIVVLDFSTNPVNIGELDRGLNKKVRAILNRPTNYAYWPDNKFK